MNRLIIADILTGKRVWQYYQLYNHTQWYNEEEIRNFQRRKLSELFNHCYRNVPYYTKLINERKINIKGCDPFEILPRFPILTKEIIQANYESFIPLNNKKISGVKTSQTGGTTGNILFKRNDANTRSSVWASYKRYSDWMGHSPNDNSLVLMGGHIKKNILKSAIKGKLANLLGKSVGIDIYDTSESTTEKVIHLLGKGKFSHIRSYPQFLYSVAKKMEEHGLVFYLKSISTTAEPVMMEHRMLFRKIFNSEVFDQYGCGEIGGISYECNMHEGMHIADERVIVETNESRELIITDLDNFTMPFIRYWNADQAVIDDKKCNCGRQSRLIKKIMGRTCDYIKGRDGQFLHWAYFWHLIFDSRIAEIRNLRKFQIVQVSSDRILIRLVSNHLSIAEEKFLAEDILGRLGEIKVEFSYEKDIENSVTGKYRPVVNKILNTESGIVS